MNLNRRVIPPAGSAIVVHNMVNRQLSKSHQFVSKIKTQEVQTYLELYFPQIQQFDGNCEPTSQKSDGRYFTLSWPLSLTCN